jgi:hypothetical protein
VLSDSYGSKAGEDDTKMNFGFTVKWNRSGRNLQGQINIIFRRIEDNVKKNYQIKSNSISTMNCTETKDGSTVISRKAVITTKATLKDLSSETSYGSGNNDLTFEVIEDVQGNGDNDKIAVTLKNGSTLLFSSDWNSGSGRTDVDVIDGGRIKVRNDGSNDKRGSYEEQAEVVTPEEQLKVYPNPFNSKATLNYLLESDGNVSIVVYNSLGMKVRELLDTYVTAGQNSVTWDGLDNRGQLLGNGVYYIMVSSGTFRKAIEVTLFK